MAEAGRSLAVDVSDPKVVITGGASGVAEIARALDINLSLFLARNITEQAIRVDGHVEFL